MADRYRGRDGVSTENSAVVNEDSENIYVDLRCDPRTRPILPATEFSGSHKKKATSSFQITSVTVQGSRLGNDGGEDSADDLDESHTEDISSEMLDCSKTTDLENDPLSSDNSNANVDDFGIVGIVLPTKQPIPVKTLKSNDTPVNFSIGVATDFGNVAIGTNVNSGVTLVTSTTTSPPVVNAQVPMVNSLPEHWQHRFKVVKIVSSEPFKRGRWLCMDFTDPPAVHHEQKSEAESVVTMIDPLNFSVSLAHSETERPNAMTHIYEIPSNQSLIGGGMSVIANTNQPVAQPAYSNIVPVTTVTTTSTVNIPATVNISSAVSSALTTALIQNAAIQTASIETVPSQASLSSVAQTQSTVPPVSLQTPMPITLSHQPQVVASNPVSQPNHATSTASIVSNVASSSAIQQLNLAPILQQSAVANGNNRSNVSKVTESSNYVPSQTNLTSQQSVSDLVATADRLVAPLMNPSPLMDVIPDALGTKNLQEGEDSESIFSLRNQLSRASGFVQQESTNGQSTFDLQAANSPGFLATLASENARKPSYHQTSAEQRATLAVVNSVAKSLSLSAPSGTSTVAIDNKIEQAMDLVKSHLMFAVREEVDVLKEKITELVDRISQLEVENGILRANASQETLSQLPSTLPGQQLVQSSAPQTAGIQPSVIHHMRPAQQLVGSAQTMVQPLQGQTSLGQTPQQTAS